jgi:hypothetical protein
MKTCFWKILIPFLPIAFAMGGWADIIYLTSGATVRGEMISFNGQEYRVNREGTPMVYSAEEVRGFVIERAAAGEGDQQRDIDQQQELLRRLDIIESKIDEFAQFSVTQNEVLQQRVYSLNPISMVRVIRSSASYSRDGTFRIRGKLANESNEVIREYRLRATLFDEYGEPLATKDHTPTVTNIGPGSAQLFEITFRNPPRGVADVEVVPFLPTRSTSEDVGSYQVPGIEYRD